ncbi:hypothetical protein OOZ15_18295 [Galbibacter sp. EGI 63066]|uniref:hypothetical protein n=1 Tax=Galbibacter sp. EGI 63066 TaxID=2993559 RepID=UPI0022494121|nr:hypothetical protein [Galbibacter sp. EGI 63066]MCX2681909.1 hypothetical protein [Galbibacter sp. EGI 63066]
MKQFIVMALVLVCGLGYSQSRWDTSIELDFVFPNKKDYFYIDGKNKIIDTELQDEGFLLSSLGIQGSYNYYLFKKLSIGVLGGFQVQSRPDFSMLKLGGVLRYHFVDRDNVYIYLQDANNFTLNKSKFKSGNNLRFGLGFPFIKKDYFNITGNLFFEQNYFKLDNAEPLLGMREEKPRSLTVKSFGISLGVKF